MQIKMKIIIQEYNKEKKRTEIYKHFASDTGDYTQLNQRDYRVWPEVRCVNVYVALHWNSLIHTNSNK